MYTTDANVNAPICGAGKKITKSQPFNTRVFKDSYVEIITGRHNSPLSVYFMRTYESGRRVDGQCSFSWEEAEILHKELAHVLKYREEYEQFANQD